MQFTSIPFFIFLFVVIVLYYMLPAKYRNYLLLVGSYYFYFSVQAEYLVLLAGSTLVNYILGRSIGAYKSMRPWLLGMGLAFNIGVLFFFKYFNFFGEQLSILFTRFSLDISIPHHSLILPIGISFYTFMALGYLLDVYWGDIKAQSNLLTFSVYLAFFPQILCGPIGRAKNLFKQFTEVHPLLYINFSNGFRLILWGLFKKMVVADNIGIYVDAVYNNIPMHSTLTLLVACLLYPLQLYTDFGGYTDIARGVGKLLGFDLMVNFRTPYVNSMSVTDYWKRNHISLTSWLKDYVFFPFMGTSSSKLRIYTGIIIMFLASGLWHGAGWMFLIWGGLQAFFLIFEDLVKWDSLVKDNIVCRKISKVITYFAVAIGLLFFRLPSLHDVRVYFHTLSIPRWNLFTGGSSILVFIISSVLILIGLEMMQDKKQFDEWVRNKAILARWTLYIGMASTIILIGVLDGSAFIYFQF